MINKIRDVRVEKLNKIIAAGMDPYPAKTERTHEISEVILNAEKFEKESQETILVGRLRAVRGHGGSVFANIMDNSGVFQLYFKKDDLAAEQWTLIELFDVGDFIQVAGRIFTTKKGEKTLLVSNCKILAKSLLPLPDKWSGLEDGEEKLRKRYLDILFNPEIKEMIEKRSIFWNAVREFHLQHGFLEVETPVLETKTGGADAKPFVTHHNAFDMDVYLRISAGELWQKRLMVAGFEKTFEIGRIFRNEGVSTEHLQDYTQCEAYWAYGNYKDMYNFLRDCYRFVAQKTFGTLKFKIRGFDVDLGVDWPIIDYTEIIKKETDIDIWQDDDKKIQEKLHQFKIKSEADNRARMVDALWKYCRKSIGGPAILVNEPKFTSPLAKSSSINPNITERFHFIIAGSEVGQGYSELNNPVDQRERFENQQKLRDAGDEEAQMADYDFVEAMEHGMPPTCGHGFSERLFSFLMDKPIKECQIFPLMRPKEQKTGSAKIEKEKTQDVSGSDLGVDSRQAENILNKYINEPITKLHSVESRAIMEGVAKHLNEDSVKWGIVGLLHDIDWDLTKQNTGEHCIKAREILKNEGASDFLIETIISHGYGCVNNEECKNKIRSTNIQHALAASETLTGLIISSTLVQPDKKLKSLSLKSLKKKFKDKSFAANCNREIIKECEKIGLTIDEFLDIGLKSLQEISNELKL